MRDPDRTVTRKRSVEYDWLVASAPDGDAKMVARLSIRHHKAGINYATYERTTEDYFQVSLRTVKVSGSTTEGIAGVESFMMFAGLGLMRIPAGNRFSAKKLREAAATGLAKLAELHDAGEEQVTSYFMADEVIDGDPNTLGGVKAGLAGVA